MFINDVEGSGKKVKKQPKNGLIFVVAIVVALFLLGCVVAAILLCKYHLIQML